MFSFLKRKYINLISDTRFSEILTGSAWALGARVISTILALVFSILVARLYGAEMVGIVAVINSFLMLATIFTVFGTNTSILRLISEHLTKYSPTSAFKVYRKTQWMVIGISIFTATVLFFSSRIIADNLFSKPHLSYYFALASIFVIFKSIMELNNSAVRGLRLIKLFALMQLLPQSCNLLFLISAGFLWPVNDVPVYALFFGFAITSIIGWFILEFTFKKKMQHSDNFSLVSGKTILAISMPMLISTAMMVLNAQIGVLMLGIFRNEAEIGFYAMAVKLATLTAFLLHALNINAAPKFSELFHAKKMDELFHVAKKSAKLIFFATTPIMLCLWIFGESILAIVFGSDFSIAYPALVILVIGQFVNLISGSSGIFMNMTGNQTVLSNIMIIAAGINIGLNFLITPKFGINGAAISAMAAISFSNISMLIFMQQKFGRTTAYFPFFHLLAKRKTT